MSSMYLWLIYLTKISVLLQVVGWITFGLSFFILLLVIFIKSLDDDFDDVIKFFKNPKKALIVILIVFISLIMVITGSMIPNKKELITIYVLKQVDKYNSEHETSVFNPDNIIEGADKKLDKISDIIDKSLNKIDKMLDEKK